MEKIIKFIKESNHGKHFIGGALIALFADNTYCALYAGAGIGAALEYKDRAWGEENGIGWTLAAPSQVWPW